MKPIVEKLTYNEADNIAAFAAALFGPVSEYAGG
jgi:hypothetical protein